MSMWNRSDGGDVFNGCVERRYVRPKTAVVVVVVVLGVVEMACKREEGEMERGTWGAWILGRAVEVRGAEFMRRSGNGDVYGMEMFRSCVVCMCG
jgi:hypothetical protein